MLIGKTLHVSIKMLGVPLELPATIMKDRRKGKVKIAIPKYGVSKVVHASIAASCVKKKKAYRWM